MSHPRTSFAAASVSITALLLAGCAPAEDEEQPNGAAEFPQPTQTETETETVEPSPTAEATPGDENGEDGQDLEDENGNGGLNSDDDGAENETPPEDEAVEEDASEDSSEAFNPEEFDRDGVEYEVEYADVSDLGELTGLRHGLHEGFERLVFEFSGEEHPNFFSVEWTDDPRTGMTREPIDVEGGGVLELEVLGLYPGPLDDSPAGDERIEFQGEPLLIEESTLFTEVHIASRYQDNAQYLIGLDTEREIRIDQQGEPSRIIIDIAS